MPYEATGATNPYLEDRLVWPIAWKGSFLADLCLCWPEKSKVPCPVGSDTRGVHFWPVLGEEGLPRESR